MKAKEYIEKYNNDNSEQIIRISKIAHSFLYEMQGMIATRKPQRESAFLSIFKEQNQKWKSFVSKIDHQLKTPDTFFIDYMKTVNEKLYDSWVTIGALKLV